MAQDWHGLSFADPVAGPVAEAFDVDLDVIQSAFTPEVVAYPIQLFLGMTMPRLGEAITNVLLSVGFLGFATWGTQNARTRKDFYELGFHFANRALPTRPEDIAQMMNEAAGLGNAIRMGNMSGVRAALVRTPEEVHGLVRSVSVQSANLAAASRAQWRNRDEDAAPPADTGGNTGSGGDSNVGTVNDSTGGYSGGSNAGSSSGGGSDFQVEASGPSPFISSPQGPARQNTLYA